MVCRHLAVLAGLTMLAASPAQVESSLHETAKLYLANIAQVAPVAGKETTYDYYERLIDDAAALGDSSVPQGYTPEEWTQTIDETAELDLIVATQLLQRHFVSMGEIRGFGEAFVRSSRDGTMQPAAVYVPKTYEPGRAAPLIVMLHGRPQSESQLVTPPYIAQLAEQTGTIVVAPWGRGFYNFRGSATDVYDALDAAERAFTIDPRKKYLAGYSMGGFSVFEVAPIRANEWAAVMCIAGALLGSDSSRVVAAMPRTPFYVLTGSADDSIPTAYPTATALFLRAAGLDVSFYSQPGGMHRLITLRPILTQAWNDMLHEIVRTPPPALGNISLPSAIPATMMRP